MENPIKWKSLSVKEKIQYSLAAIFGASSIIIGFVAFILLMEIPTSVITISMLWASVCCGLIGISLHFRNELTEFKSKCDDRLNNIDKEIDERIRSDMKSSD